MEYYSKKIEDIYKLMLEEEKQIYGIQNNNKDIVKIILNNKENFASLINEFINMDENVNSQDLEKVINIPNMIKDNFKEIDFIYKTKDEKAYYLLEHQEIVDYTIVYRMLNYTVNIMKYIYENKMINERIITFPKIIPIVLYTGKHEWDSPISLENIQEQVVKECNLFRFEYKLINLSELNIDIEDEDQVKKQMVEIMIKNGANIDEICKYIGISKGDIIKILK